MKPKKAIRLEIPVPCSEKWDKMKPTEAGLFCMRCNHEVIDFSSKSDAEIFRTLTNAENGSICGVFSDDQLRRSIQNPIPHTNRLWPKLAVGFMLMVAAPGFILAQSPVKIPVSTEQVESAKEKEAEPVCYDGEGFVEVKVKGKWKRKRWELQGAKVTIAGMNGEFVTDENGVVRIELPQELIGKKIEVSVSGPNCYPSMRTLRTHRGEVKRAAFLLDVMPPRAGGRTIYHDAL